DGKLSKKKAGSGAQALACFVFIKYCANCLNEQTHWRTEVRAPQQDKRNVWGACCLHSLWGAGFSLHF
ncbi:hypothetical protein, partial [Psychromonas antarctica]|uniref:hypothetical protein n=1 Tax=Psychromonas antarctica TaxID=67573 RepID=UPI001EE92B8D